MMKKYILTFGFLALFFTNSCDDGFEELNENPFLPTQTDIGPLFNQVISSLRLGWNEQFYLHNETLYGITQQAALTAATFQNISIGTEEVWANYYAALAHIREIERRLEDYEGDPETLNNVRAQLKIITAYKTFRLTDLFGDIPFFDAGKGFESLDFSRPAFDRQEDIYLFLLDELKWAVENINLLASTSSGESYISFGDFDTFLGNDLLRWIKFANSLRLRHALRMADKAPTEAGEIIKEIIENDLPLIDVGEDIVMLPSAQNWENLGVNWSFREHNKLRMGSTIWQQMSETDATDGSGIFDPRAYVFFETNNDNEWVAFPQVPPAGTVSSGGIPYQQHRDNNYNVKGSSNIYSPFNYYLIRDEKDIPEIILTAAEVQFVKAEIYLRGIGVAEDEGQADAEYTIGLVNSIQFWQQLANNSTRWSNAPSPLSSGELFQISNHPRLSIFTASDKLQLVYAQRWIDAFRQPWEAFALSRRTQLTPREGDFQEFYRFSYPPSEAENNPDNWTAQVSLMGDDSPRIKVWWMP